jgi:sugar fermentation stimulation protein A
MTVKTLPGLGLAGLKLARLKARYKRFFCDCELDTDEIITAHCPNPGKMLGVLQADAPVLLTSARPVA